MPDRVIGCCGASVWTKVIGWIHTIGYLILMVVCAIAFFTGVALYVEERRRANQEPYLLHIAPYQDFFEKDGAVLLFFLILSTIGFVMGIVLLVGSYKMKPRFLLAWTIFACIELAATIVFFIYQRFAEDHFLVGGIVWLILNIAIQVFGIWVVQIHRKEMLQYNVETEGVLQPY